MCVLLLKPLLQDDPGYLELYKSLAIICLEPDGSGLASKCVRPLVCNKAYREQRWVAWLLRGKKTEAQGGSMLDTWHGTLRAMSLTVAHAAVLTQGPGLRKTRVIHSSLQHRRFGERHRSRQTFLTSCVKSTSMDLNVPFLLTYPRLIKLTWGLKDETRALERWPLDPGGTERKQGPPDKCCISLALHSLLCNDFVPVNLVVSMFTVTKEIHSLYEGVSGKASQRREDPTGKWGVPSHGLGTWTG